MRARLIYWWKESARFKVAANILILTLNKLEPR
jgi:hypothetical protein